MSKVAVVFWSATGNTETMGTSPENVVVGPDLSAVASCPAAR